VTIARYLVCYVAIALAFGALDFAWLSFAGPNLYRPEIGTLLADKVRGLPAALFYFIYIGGLTAFVALPALDAGDWRQAFARGAGFGLVAYAAYDLTNQATLQVWSTRVTVCDLVWGAFASALAGGAGAWVTDFASRRLGWR
jgi:uncharacterized membrane protein